MDRIANHPIDAVEERMNRDCEDGLQAVKSLYEILGHKGSHTEHLRKLERVLEFMRVDMTSVLELAKEFEGKWVEKDNKIYDLEQQLRDIQEANALHDTST